MTTEDTSPKGTQITSSIFFGTTLTFDAIHIIYFDPLVLCIHKIMYSELVMWDLDRFVSICNFIKSIIYNFYICMQK